MTTAKVILSDDVWLLQSLYVMAQKGIIAKLRKSKCFEDVNSTLEVALANNKAKMIEACDAQVEIDLRAVCKSTFDNPLSWFENKK